MNTLVQLPAPDPELIAAVRAAYTAWLQERCAVTRGQARIQWSATVQLTAHFATAQGLQSLGVRQNDVIGGETVETEIKPAKKQKRKVLKDGDLNVIQKKQDWNRMMSGPEAKSADVRPDSFRYREREKYE
jgi:hypothetical protein